MSNLLLRAKDKANKFIFNKKTNMYEVKKMPKVGNI